MKTELANLIAYVQSKDIEQGLDLSKLETLVDALKSMPTFKQCTVNNYDGEYLPVTSSEANIRIPAKVKYYYNWVNIAQSAEYDTEVFCIFINGEWHQAQSIDFDFID